MNQICSLSQIITYFEIPRSAVGLGLACNYTNGPGFESGLGHLAKLFIPCPQNYFNITLSNNIKRICSLSQNTSTGLPRITRGIISICTLQTGDLFLGSGSEPTINVSGEAGHKIDCWLAIARQEKIVNLKGLSGYNPPHITSETCT